MESDKRCFSVILTVIYLLTTLLEYILEQLKILFEP